MLPYQSTMITAAVSDAANVPMVTAELPTGFPATGARNIRSPRKRKSNKKKDPEGLFLLLVCCGAVLNGGNGVVLPRSYAENRAALGEFINTAVL